MLLKINFESDTPIYIQLRNQIIEGIAKNELQDGSDLPSVRQLAGDIGINLHTVNKAYSLLKDDGFIKLDRRKGAIVSLSPEMLTQRYMEGLREQLGAIIAEAHCRGMKAEEFNNICREIFEYYRKEN